MTRRHRCSAVLVASALGVGLVASAPVQTDIPKIYVTAAAATLVEQGLAAAAPTGDAATEFQEVPAAGVRFLPNVARATNVAWIDSNGWRFARGLRKANYAQLPAGQSPISAAEAFFFDVDAILNPDPKDVQDLGNMLRFLKAQQQAPMPPLVNVGVVDDGTPIMAEVMNLLTRRNLLYKVVAKPEPSLDVNVQLGTPDFPAEAAANPYEFAARVRAKLGDDKRLVRIYGTSTVLARLTGSGGRARLSLLSFARNRQQTGGPQAMRVRLVGRYRPTRFAAYGAAEGAELGDLRHPGNTTEFWVPDFSTLAVVDLEADNTQGDAASIIESAHAAGDLPMAADPNALEWANAPRVFARVDKAGVPVGGPPTEIRSRWTAEHLYLLYICPYTELNLKPDPVTGEETPRLWNWDVAEAFIGSDETNIGRYKEFQVSPQGEWVDLDIDRGDSKRQEGMRWNSGYTVAARIDRDAKVWYGLMRIPFRAIDSRAPENGRTLRIGLFRISGANTRQHHTWRPTGGVTFHAPEAFGTLRLSAGQPAASAGAASGRAASENGMMLVYFATYTGEKSKSKGIYVSRLDLGTGKVTTPELAAQTENPSFLNVHPKETFLYAANEVRSFEGKDMGSVSGFSVDRQTGRLTPLNQQGSGGRGPVYLVVDKTGRNVLVSNYGGGSVAVLPIKPDGMLEPASAFVQHTGSSVHPTRQRAPRAHSINLSPSNRFAYVADLGLDKVLIYRFDAEKGSLAPADPPFATVQPGAGPRHFAFHPQGRFAYVINEINVTLTAFSVDPELGKLTEVQTVSTLPEGQSVQEGFSTAEVQVHPSGRFLYGSNRGHDSITVFAIDEKTGRLTFVQNEPTQGSGPRGFGIDPTGQYLLAANQRSDSVVVFRIDAKTGRLSPTGQTLEVGSPASVKFVRSVVR
jgi:6-phosphogluconolactonase